MECVKHGRFLSRLCKYDKILSVSKNNNLDDIINGNAINNTGLSASDLIFAKKIKQFRTISHYSDDEIIEKLISSTKTIAKLGDIIDILPHDVDLDIEGDATIGDKTISSFKLSSTDFKLPEININASNDYYKMIANAISNGLNVIDNECKFVMLSKQSM